MHRHRTCATGPAVGLSARAGVTGRSLSIRCSGPGCWLASLRLSLLLFPLGVSLLQCEASLPAPFAVGVHYVVVFSPYPAYRRGSSAFAFVLSDAVAGCARDFARALACGAPDSRAVSARRAVLRAPRGFHLGFCRCTVQCLPPSLASAARHLISHVVGSVSLLIFPVRGPSGCAVWKAGRFFCRPCFWPFCLAVG